MSAGSLDDARRELGTLPPEQFVARRAELARAARTAGDRPGAQAIMALRKPTKSASLLNRLAAARPDRIAELLDLGADFRRAQDDLDPDRLFELTMRRRRLVTELAGLASTATGELAPTPAGRDELVGTLNAATADENVGTRLARGELDTAIEWSGLGSGFGGLDGASADGPMLRVLPGGKAPKATATTERADAVRSTSGPAPSAPARSGPARSGPARSGPAPSAQAKATEAAAAQKARAERQEATRLRARAAERAAQAQLDRLEARVKKLTAQLDRETAQLDEARSAVGRARAAYDPVSDSDPDPDPDSDSVNAPPPPAAPARGPARSEP